MKKPTESHPCRFILWLALIAGSATAISLLASYYCRHPMLRFDENYYYPLAESISKGDYQEGYIVRAPLYPLMLASVFKVFGEGFWPVLVVQSILRGITVFGVGYIARRFLTPRAGLIAAGLITVYPAMVSNYIRFMTEVLYVPAFVLSYLLLERALNTSSIAGSLKAGAASGVAALVRSISLMFTMLMAVWFLVREVQGGRVWKHNLVNSALLVGAMLAVISPWAIRNALSPTGFVLVSNDAAFNLWLITSGKTIKEATPEWKTWGTQAQRQAEAYRRWAAYLKENPAFHFRRIAKVLPRLVDHRWDSPVGMLSQVRRGYVFREVPALRKFLEIAHPVLFYLVLTGGILGVLVLERHPARRNLMLVAVGYFILVHSATLSRARFLLPIQVLLAIYAGGLIDSGLSRLGLTMRGRRRES